MGVEDTVHMKFGPGICDDCGRRWHEGPCEPDKIALAFGGGGQTKRAMRHGMNCPATTPLNESDCTCGLWWREQIETYRDIFAEITTKAKPYLYDPNDPGRVVAYVIPCGPIHRAAGRVSHQMFDGEALLGAAVAKIGEVEKVRDDWCADYTKARDALKAVIDHWDEFGPHHGFDELLERLRPLAKVMQ